MKTEDIEKGIEQLSIQQALEYFVGRFAGQVAFSTSLGLEDKEITDIIFRNRIDVEVFTIDTGRLFPETYELLQITGGKYGASIKTYFPAADKVEELVSRNGINCFYKSVELRKQCCHVRKVLPLQRALGNKKVWVTGLRAEQSENRHGMKTVSYDTTYHVIKYNPLVKWTYEDVLKYLKQNDVPYNPLHDKGFISIGCAPVRAPYITEKMRGQAGGGGKIRRRNVVYMKRK